MSAFFIQLRWVIDWRVSGLKSNIFCFRAAISSSMFEKQVFPNSVRNSRQTCSIGFISGVYGGMYKRVIRFGILMYFESCHGALSHTRTIWSLGYLLASASINAFISLDLCPLLGFLGLLLFRFSPLFLRPGLPFVAAGLSSIWQKKSPVSGSTAPNISLYSRTRCLGITGLFPLAHQQYLGSEMRPKLASSSKNNLILPFSCG